MLEKGHHKKRVFSNGDPIIITDNEDYFFGTFIKSSLVGSEFVVVVKPQGSTEERTVPRNSVLPYSPYIVKGLAKSLKKPIKKLT